MRDLYKIARPRKAQKIYFFDFSSEEIHVQIYLTIRSIDQVIIIHVTKFELIQEFEGDIKIIK